MAFGVRFHLPQHARGANPDAELIMAPVAARQEHRHPPLQCLIEADILFLSACSDAFQLGGRHPSVLAACVYRQPRKTKMLFAF